MPGNLAAVGMSKSPGTPFTLVLSRSANKASSLFRRFGFPYLRKFSMRKDVELSGSKEAKSPVLSWWWKRGDDDRVNFLLLSVHEDDVASQAKDKQGEN